MTRVFVDTSALLAFLVRTDVAHERALSTFKRLEAMEASLVTSSYVLVELYALLARRFGVDKVVAFRDGLSPLLDVVWVEREQHERGLDLLIKRDKRRLSLVDTSSFVLIRTLGIDRVFAYDPHFEREGFILV